MTAMALILTLLAAVNLAVAYLWFCQRALENSLAPNRKIWPAIVPVRRPADKAQVQPMYRGGVMDPVPAPAPVAAAPAPAKPAAAKTAPARRKAPAKAASAPAAATKAEAAPAKAPKAPAKAAKPAAKPASKARKPKG